MPHQTLAALSLEGPSTTKASFQIEIAHDITACTTKRELLARCRDAARVLKDFTDNLQRKLDSLSEFHTMYLRTELAVSECAAACRELDLHCAEHGC
jgi:hypothetical protein